VETTITRKGQVTQTTRKEQQNYAVMNFAGGYLKIKYNEKDVPDGLMLEDKVEISIRIIEDNNE
jgi:hypothetical protein